MLGSRNRTSSSGRARFFTFVRTIESFTPTLDSAAETSSPSGPRHRVNEQISWRGARPRRTNRSRPQDRAQETEVPYMSFTARPALDPVDVRPLLSEVHDALIALMAGLSPQDWCRPTACVGWSVKDVALHLLGGDISLLSRERDGDESGLLPPGPT